MYQNKLVASLKANGKILREFKDTVYIPFGSEYSFLLKNLNTVRALVNVFIDGEDMTPGGLVLNAGQEVDLERSIKGGNLREGNRFKFIERTSAIENGPRGVKLEDGLVRIEFQFEKPPLRVSELPDWQRKSIFGPMYGNHGGIVGSNGASEYPNTVDKFTNAFGTYSQVNVNGALRGIDYSKGESMKLTASGAINSTLQAMNISATSAHEGQATMDSYVAPMNEVGITVPGSKSTQSFTTTYMNAMEPEKHTIVLKILGETPDNEPVRKPITTQHKPKCVTCGKQNKANAKFCSECGTALEIFA